MALTIPERKAHDISDVIFDLVYNRNFTSEKKIVINSMSYPLSWYKSLDELMDSKLKSLLNSLGFVVFKIKENEYMISLSVDTEVEKEVTLKDIKDQLDNLDKRVSHIERYASMNDDD